MLEPILYHYIHCPYCIRVRMAAGFLDLHYKSVPLNYDDEETPIKLTGQKMCPIWVDPSGKAMLESLDIILKIDTHNRLIPKEYLKSAAYQTLEEKINQMGKYIHNLAMPHWIYTKEFNEKSRSYFQKKKELKRGPFKDLIKNRAQFEEALVPLLLSLEKELTPYYKSEKLGVDDILIASHLWGLYVVPEFQFSDKIHNYLQAVKKACRFEYHEDLWK